VTITTGLVDTYSTPTLLQMVASGQLTTKPFATHHFTMHDFMRAYDTFAAAETEHALKVVITKS